MTRLDDMLTDLTGSAPGQLITHLRQQHHEQHQHQQHQQQLPDRRNKRHVNHVSRACDRCRKRKIRCNGEQPACNVCVERGWECEYEEEDRRKTNSELEDLKARMAQMERLLSTSSKGQGSGNTNPRFSPSSSRESSGTTDDRSGSSATPAPLARPIRPLPRSSQLSLNFGEGERSSDEADEAEAETQAQAEPKRGEKASASSPPMADSNHFDRLKRSDDGPLMHFGPTSIWRHDPRPRSISAPDPPHPDLHPGEYVDWSRNLPRSLDLSRALHDAAIQYFAAFYAPWCGVVDMPSFLRDLEACNLVSPIQEEPEQGPDTNSPTSSSSRMWRTSFYSPLLHNTVLYLGMFLLRTEEPEMFAALRKVFNEHCSKLLIVESETPVVSSLRGFNLLASCQFGRDERHPSANSNYIYFGMSISAVHAMGLNINCDAYVRRGLMTAEERNTRDAAFWTIYVQDVLRAISTGRVPLLPEASDIAYPLIDPVVDEVPWQAPTRIPRLVDAPSPGTAMSGSKGMRSTVFHWTAKLSTILRNVLETLYSPRSEISPSRRDQSVYTLTRQLEKWHHAQPIQHPETQPLPHILLMHMLYQLTTIYLHRPFYRSSAGRGPSPAERCDSAAEQVMVLLKLFDGIHGMRTGPMTLIHILFAATTVFLLKAVTLQADGGDSYTELQNVDNCIAFMGHCAATWNQAHRGLEILMSLRSEWLPDVPPPPNPLAPTLSSGDLGDLTALLDMDEAAGSGVLSGLSGPTGLVPGSGLGSGPGPGSGSASVLGSGMGTSTGMGMSSGMGTGMGTAMGGMGMGTGVGVGVGLGAGTVPMLGLGSMASTATAIPPPAPMDSTDLSMDLHDWLMTQDFHDVIFSGETYAWTGAALGLSS